MQELELNGSASVGSDCDKFIHNYGSNNLEGPTSTSFEIFPFTNLKRCMSQFAATDVAFAIHDFNCPECGRITKETERDLQTLIHAYIDKVNDRNAKKPKAIDTQEEWNCKVSSQLQSEWGKWPAVYQNKPKLSLAYQQKFQCCEHKRMESRAADVRKRGTFHSINSKCAKSN